MKSEGQLTIDIISAPPCGENEEFSLCMNGGCGPRLCSQLGQPIRCVKIDPAYCKKGCVCIDGYLRNKHGICVKKEQCDSKYITCYYYDMCKMT